MGIRQRYGQGELLRRLTAPIVAGLELDLKGQGAIGSHGGIIEAKPHLDPYLSLVDGERLLAESQTDHLALRIGHLCHCESRTDGTHRIQNASG